MNRLIHYCLPALIILFSHGLHAQWISTLPQQVQDSIYWQGDHEEGNLSDWTMDAWLYPGGGIFNTGGSEVETDADNTFAHSGTYSARATITNAWQAQNGSRAIRLMRWTDKAWNDGGAYFPKSSYYSAFYYFPNTFNPNKYAPWDPGDGGWWNIFQFKSDDINGTSQPVWTLNVDHNDATQEMYLYLYTKYNIPASHSQSGTPLTIPVGQWVHLEAFYLASTGNTPDGTIKIWQDGNLILDINNVVTTLASEQVVWGIGNYTDHIDGGTTQGTASLYFDDCIVGTLPVHPHLNATLPVEWLHFMATQKGNLIRLDWTTGIEINNDFFEIERSMDGNIFDQIGMLPADTESTPNHTYVFYDRLLSMQPSQKVFYRIKQVDADGTYSFSDVVSVSFERKNGLQGTVFPNPVQDEAYFRYEGFVHDLVHLKMFDMRGKVFWEGEFEGAELAESLKLPISELAAGIYFLNASTDEMDRNFRIVLRN